MAKLIMGTGAVLSWAGLLRFPIPYSLGCLVRIFVVNIERDTSLLA